MNEVLEDHEGSVNIGGQRFTNFRFANASSRKKKADALVNRLDISTKRCEMEIDPDKTKTMTNNPDVFQREISINGQQLEAIENLKYLRSIICN